MTDAEFPVTHSIPSAEALLDHLRSVYDIGPIKACRYWQIGLNDTYMVIGEKKRYVLRVYRVGRRTPSEIDYELDALAHLSRMDVPVSTPIPRNDGARITALSTPEGKRHCVLFTYADGTTYLYGNDIQITYEYGGAVARIHWAMDKFSSSHQRFNLDLDFLIHKPMAYIGLFLRHRPTDWDYLCRLSERVVRNISQMDLEGLEKGFCHGDTNGYNAHFTAYRNLIFFDFDFCGIGWRAYDLASFRWLALMNPKEDRWENFLRGYTQIRPLQDVDLSAVPFLVAARQIWIDGMQIENGPDWGVNNIDDGYFDRKLKYLRELEASHFV